MKEHSSGNLKRRMILMLFIIASVSFNAVNDNVYGENSNIFDFKMSTPEEFLVFLGKDIRDQMPNNPIVSFYTINQTLDDWIKPEHIPGLIDLIDSDIVCRPVVSVYSSTLPTKLSTVGDEAAFLIQGFRKKHYPPEIFSTTYSVEEKKEILQWWECENKQNKCKK